MTDEIKIKDKDIVVPGEVLATGMGYLPSRGTYREGEKILSQRVGLIHIDGKVIKLIPLSGKYEPKPRDTIVAQVEDILFSGWRLDTNTAYSAVLGIQNAGSQYIPKGANLTEYFEVGDYVVAKITNVSSQKLIDVTMKGPGLRKLQGGRTITVNTYKVPRIIGKKGSMISMVKNATGCRIIVGQNGVVWLSGEPDKEIIAIDAIRKIEEESHISGLTDRMKAYLEEKTGAKIEESAPAAKSASAGKPASARKPAPAGKPAPARKPAPAAKSASAGKPAPAGKSASAGKSAPAKSEKAPKTGGEKNDVQ